MRVLFLHCDYLEYEVKEKAVPSAEDLPEAKRRGRIEDALVCFVSAESRDEGDPDGIAALAVGHVLDVAGQVNTKRIALYPYAHLSSSLAAPEAAKAILRALESRLRTADLEVLASPFGYYKSFKVSVKGHPLSELSREIVVGEAPAEGVSEAVRAESKLVSSWSILDLEGNLHPVRIEDGQVQGFDFADHEQLRQFAGYEMAKSREAKEEPAHVKHMRELELVDYEPGSDPGNLRFYPKGRLVKSLLEEITTKRLIEYGALEVESPVMYDFEHPALKSYLDRFPARQYVVTTPNKRAFLRFSACFGQFLIARDMVLSYRQLPLPLYELTRYSFRAEQRGELAGLRRLRAFTMPDCHGLCADMEQAKEHMMVRFEVAWKLMQDIGFAMPDDLEVGMRLTEGFWKEHSAYVKAYARRWGKPILVEMWSEQFFYFVMKWEWNFVDGNAKAAALTTDQIDTENAERFGITFTDAEGRDRHPLILHQSPTGATERLVYALLEKAARDAKAGKPPMLPVWLSPVQVRLLPVSSDQLGHCLDLVASLPDVRVDVDDSGETLSRMVRRAEKDWIPYVAVVGRREVGDGTVNVRIRATREQVMMTPAQLRQRIASETAGRPFRPLPLPRVLSKQPTFRG